MCGFAYVQQAFVFILEVLKARIISLHIICQGAKILVKFQLDNQARGKKLMIKAKLLGEFSSTFKASNDVRMVTDDS